MGPSMGLISSRLPFLRITFTLALTVAALKILFYWHFTDTSRQTGRLVYNL